MAQSSPTNHSILVRQIARLIRRFNSEQMAQLVELVPELQTVDPKSIDISAEQAELADYFDHQLESFSNYPPMQDDDLFIAGLTVAEFFALPEAEQDRLWQEAHLETEHKLNPQEHPVQPNALPAR